MLGDLFQALRTSQTGLIANQGALDVVARNVANTNTPGYSAKVVNLETRALNGVGAGVDLARLSRTVDQGLLRTLRQETARVEALKVQDAFLARAQTLFGSPDSNGSISHSIATFQAALETLALAPESTLGQVDVVRRGEELTAQFRGLSENLQALRQEADQRITATVAEVNRLTAQIADLNTKIAHANHLNQDTTTLLDQRDQALDRLSALLDVRVFGRSDGAAIVFTASGRTLVDGAAIPLSHTPAAQLAAGALYPDQIDGVFLGDGSRLIDLTTEIGGGELAGLIRLRDQTLPNLQAALDELATGVRQTVNEIHNRGVPFPGLAGTISGSRTFSDPTVQTIAFHADADTRLIVFDGAGNQIATTTVRTVIGGASTTIEQLAADLNAWLSTEGYGSAGLTGDGRLSLSLTAGRTLGLRDETAVATSGSASAEAVLDFDADGDTVPDQTARGFSAFFGLNDFFVDRAEGTGVGVSSSLAVRTDLSNYPHRVSTAIVQWDQTRGLAGSYVISPGDNTAIRALTEAFGDGRAFGAAGALPPITTGFADYAALIISNSAADASAISAQSAQGEELVMTLEHKLNSLRGVNLDQELANLMLYEQAYAAAARVIAVVQSMFDSLERAIR